VHSDASVNGAVGRPALIGGHGLLDHHLAGDDSFLGDDRFLAAHRDTNCPLLEGVLAGLQRACRRADLLHGDFLAAQRHGNALLLLNDTAADLDLAEIDLALADLQLLLDHRHANFAFGRAGRDVSAGA